MRDKEKVKEQNRKYYALHTKKIIEKVKEYYLNRKPAKLKYEREYRNSNKEKILIQRYLQIDKRKNLDNNLTEEWLKENITNKECIYCGETEKIGCDRIDNSKGHTIENVVPCCNICNPVRNNFFTVDEMKELGKIIRKIKLKRKLNNA